MKLIVALCFLLAASQNSVNTEERIGLKSPFGVSDLREIKLHIEINKMTNAMCKMKSDAQYGLYEEMIDNINKTDIIAATKSNAIQLTLKKYATNLTKIEKCGNIASTDIVIITSKVAGAISNCFDNNFSMVLKEISDQELVGKNIHDRIDKKGNENDQQDILDDIENYKKEVTFFMNRDFRSPLRVSSDICFGRIRKALDADLEEVEEKAKKCVTK